MKQQQQDMRGMPMLQAVKTVDAIGLQCPGPILRLRDELANMMDGQALTITASDPSFDADVKSWCRSTGNELVNVEAVGGNFQATVVRRVSSAGKAVSPRAAGNKKTIVVFSGDLDKVMAAFIIANGAASTGSEVTMFFTFWGLNVLRRPHGAIVPMAKSFVERMFGWMMPRGADKLTLSKMNMGGMGTRMMKAVMARKNVSALPELIQSAQAAGVHLVACSMSMDVMGIKPEELIDGVEQGGVAVYLERADEGNVNLFI